MLLEQAQRFTEHCVPTGTETGPLHDKIRGPPEICSAAPRTLSAAPPLRRSTRLARSRPNIGALALGECDEGPTLSP
jgi:hypothetical protein